MDEKQAKQISSAIILKAIEDVDLLYKKVCKVRSICTGTGLYNYFIDIKKNQLKEKMFKRIPPTRWLPFKKPHEYTAVSFFFKKNKWRQVLFEIIDINNVPKKTLKQLKCIQHYYRYCYKCVDDAEKRANKNVRDILLKEELNGPAKKIV
jgi:hypothetical protein